MHPVGLAAVLAALWSSTFAQPVGSTDVLAQLLAEVRALRIVMEQSGTAGPRIQLLTARLSIQESRVARLARDLDDARANLVRITEAQRRASEMFENLEAAVPSESDPARRRQLEAELKSLKQQIDVQSSEEQFLRNQESSLQASYDTEQARWLEISNRLDELERSLAR
jgi:endonuclease/exonuclease/phosphatase (EEP) superfamily protein YafD